jgi:hypothetical protein
VRLIWHIAKKDIRRMTWPVTAWLAFIVIAAAWFAVGAPLGPVTQRWEADAWTATVRWLTLLATIIWLLLGYLIAAGTVLEDSLIGTAGFWQTRPVSNSQLFVAKTTAVLVLCVIAPALVLLPVWIGVGFDRAAVVAAFATTMFLHFIVTLVAVTIGSLSGNLRQFLFLSVAICAVYFLCSGWYPTHFIATEYTIEVRRSRNAIVQFGVIPVFVAISAFQYLVRNTIRSWLLLALALVVCLAVRLVWPWNILPLLGMEVPQIRSNVTALAEVSGISPSLILELNMPAAADSIFVPYPQVAYMNSGAKEVRLTFRDSPWLMDNAVERLALGERVDATEWRLSAFVPDRPSFPNEVVRGRILCDVALTDLHRFPPMPVRKGASTSNDSSRVHVESIAALLEHRRIVIVREQEAATTWFPWYHRSLAVEEYQNDKYVLVSTPVRRARVLSVDDMETVGFAGMAIRYRAITVPSADDTDNSMPGAMLTKLRFVRRRASAEGLSQSWVDFEAIKGLSLDARAKGAR